MAEIVDLWQVEDNWWQVLLARRYLRLLLDDGRLLTVFEDLIDGGWYLQRYSLPGAAARWTVMRTTFHG